MEILIVGGLFILISLWCLLGVKIGKNEKLRKNCKHVYNHIISDGFFDKNKSFHCRYCGERNPHIPLDI